MIRRAHSAGQSGSESWGTKPRRLAEADLDITPMIDVTFLLLIFFMVTSTMEKDPDRDVPTAEHGQGVESATATIIRIKAPAAGGTASIEFQDQEVTVDEIPAIVEEGVQQNRMHVIIKADRETPHGFVQNVTRAVNSVEGVRFSLGVRDKPLP